ncbi:hydrolase 76 protein [Didymella heteroderae]|uniref:Mannan endo-1,6-alpha-mannosidase n=1 Tax=Didymella heteroderae TaxID=1769908 RepID=A0A9P5BVU2_9PLEO|nr:hydrolase 76 protein [Didymella heteroderae]
MAVRLDVHSTDSIKSIANGLAQDLRQYYTGDREGHTPGTLPEPYYWWECGAMLNTFIGYWHYTGDDQYNSLTMQAMEHQIGDSNAFMPANQTRSLGNDDQAFWGMAAMSAAENKLPDLGKGRPSWLSLAQAVFNTQKSRWDETTCGGGLRWQIFFFNDGYDYKNTISNGCFFNIAARLYKYLGDDTYSQWAERIWDWETSVGLITRDHYFFDGAWATDNCTSFDYKQWTYNAGVHLAGAAAMWNVTQSDVWRNRLEKTIEGLGVFFHENVMIEVTCEIRGTCNVDQRSFKAYLARWMGYTAIVAPWTRDLIVPRLRGSAIAAAAQCTNGTSKTSCNLYWATGEKHDGSFGVGEQMAALEVILNLLYPTVAGPVTHDSGGISHSQPDAGIDPTHHSFPRDSVRLSDKIGGSALTIMVLVGTVAGAWWMLSETDEPHFRRE